MLAVAPESPNPTVPAGHGLQLVFCPVTLLKGVWRGCEGVGAAGGGGSRGTADGYATL